MTDAIRLRTLADTLGFAFANESLALLALTHPSCRDRRGDNQRLEFLGDAVLQLASAQMLYFAIDRPEGVLTRLRASLVCGATLARIGRGLGLNKLIRVADGANANIDSVLGDGVEALLAAVYLDRGMDAAQALAQRWLEPLLAELDDQAIDEKSQLQERLAALGRSAPVYADERTGGSEHAPVFASAVTVNGECLGRGTGNSKKAAQKAAARAALSQLD